MVIKNGWLHGTHDAFERWQVPPPPSKRKPELVRHGAVFLTRDRTLALADDATRLCEADLLPEASVIDVLGPGPESEHMRGVVRGGVLGRHHYYATTPELWTEAWRSGEMMRFATANRAMVAQMARVQNLAMQRNLGLFTAETNRAWLEAQNLTRRWIEELVSAVRTLGFDALAGREVDTFRPEGPVACDVLFVLDGDALTPPRWVDPVRP